MKGNAGGLGTVLDHLADLVFGDVYFVHVRDHIMRDCDIYQRRAYSP
jgi:hypothetical protein